MRQWFGYLIIAVLLASLASAQTESMKLLAVSESDGKLVGSMAELTLTIKEGTGRVFIDTLPASKLDTQITTRFAKEMACRYLNVDCSGYDFFYVIKADSTIVGGPSAGAAMTLLTISILGDMKMDPDTAMTGTINSGYLIGSVGGVKEKIDAAADKGIKKVLIPITESTAKEGNKTVDFAEYGRNRGIEVIKVADIDDALYYFTGKDFRRNNRSVEITPSYENTMAALADMICGRSKDLKEELSALKEDNPLVNETDIIESDDNTTEEDTIVDIEIDENLTVSINRTSKENKTARSRIALIEEKADNLTQSGKESFGQKAYYSAASYCFGANVNYNYLILKLSNKTIREIGGDIEGLDKEINDFDKFLDSHQIKTITDLEAYSVSKERLIDSKDSLNKSIDALKKQKMESVFDNMAYSRERLYSSKSWAQFLGKEGKEFEISKDKIKESCENKLLEAQIYYQYLELILPRFLESAAEDIKKAEKDSSDGNYELCLHHASLGKAQVSVILSTLGLEEKDLEGHLDRKLNAAKKVIVEDQEKGIFPILGYSYYEYSQSLRNSSIYSALVYAEYSLELSSLDIYFEPTKAKVRTTETAGKMLFIYGFAIGLMSGGVLFFAVRAYMNKPRKMKFKKPEHTKIKFRFGKRPI